MFLLAVLGLWFKTSSSRMTGHDFDISTACVITSSSEVAVEGH